VKEYKGYRDGYYQLAAVEYQLGNTQIAKSYIVKALHIDPTFPQGKILLNEVEK
jgi:hypothetical protein